MKKAAGGGQCPLTPLSVGDVVLVDISSVDRGRLDPLRLPGVVVEVTAPYWMYCRGIEKLLQPQ